ncbi:hypothetical protein Pla110_08010 [Polystyrenella longa]|uniref:Ion transport protein n=1 Tax=Polystyrenella longa TaxID=2528007 RepID=A0A518CIT1_9PLAN|nr:ion transporter [Polystyrenella longa]QDU79097.1 hypothetical protein Pla110_08010 [Polystyrenella longa]
MEAKRLDFEQRMMVPMFLLGVVFLLFLAGFLHGTNLHILQGEEEMSPIEHFEGFWSNPLVVVCRWGMLLLWPCFLFEAIMHYRYKSPRWKKAFYSVLFPPARIGAADFQTGKTVWLPFLGKTKINAGLRHRVSRGATFPMIIIALMVLPLLAVEHTWKGQIAEHPILSYLLRGGEGFIWFAFTFEFIVMLHIVEKKFQYCKSNWLDIAIILLPVLGFLRILRLGRLVQLTSRIPQLGRMVQLYNMRGLIMRLWRAVLVFELLDRLLRGTPEKQLTRCQLQLQEKEAELKSLQEKMAALQELVNSTAIPVTEVVVSDDSSDEGDLRVA